MDPRRSELERLLHEPWLRISSVRMVHESEVITDGLHPQCKLVHLLCFFREFATIANWHCTRDCDIKEVPGRRSLTQARAHTTDAYYPSYSNPTHTQHRSAGLVVTMLSLPHRRHGSAHVTGFPCSLCPDDALDPKQTHGHCNNSAVLMPV